MKGIIRAGGSGTRLYPATRAVNKHFFPIYDKPAIYYPVSLLIGAGVTELLLCVFEKDLQAYRELFGDGGSFGVSIRYQAENRPMTVPETLLESRAFLGTEAFAVALGDNVFLGEALPRRIREAAARFETKKGAAVFCKAVDDPRDYGVLEYDGEGAIRSLESKPRSPKSNYAVTGLFFFDRDVFETIGRTKPASDGSVNFGDLLRQYLKEGRLHSEILDGDIQWFDTGTPERMYQACTAVRAFQQEHGVYAGSVADAAFDAGLIGAARLAELSAALKPTDYGAHLARRAAISG